MANILGLNAGHPDSSAVLVVDGEIVAACAEERLGKRVKHSNEFPVNAIKAVMNSGQISLNELDAIAVAGDPTRNVFAKIKFGLSGRRGLIKAASGSVRNFSIKRSDSIVKRVNHELGSNLGGQFSGAVFHVEHHLAHIASAYYTSGLEGQVTGISYDGSGDFVSLMLAKCEAGAIKVVDRVYLPDSLGIFYTALCQFIGFDKFGEEYKVMGLAPYGENKYAKQMNELLSVSTGERGWFKLNKQYFNMHSGRTADEVSNPAIEMGQMYSDSISCLLGTARRNRTDPIEQIHKDIAKSVQVKFEQVALEMIKRGLTRIPSNKLVLSGGCALNGVCNARILREIDLLDLYVHPASSDDGTAAGAALYAASFLYGDYRPKKLLSPFLGPIRQRLFDLASSSIKSQHYVKSFDEATETVEAAADLLSKGLVIGWFQGRSEWGPRALGNRSILGNPLDPGMKDKINKKIKKREGFRPFAPSVLDHEANKYFSQSVDSPYMTFVVEVRPEWRDKLPAITHVDGTARIQTVSEENNKLYYDLLTAVKARTGIGMLLNTSFNENEPVVETPEQAYSCFERTDMDALILDNTLFIKS